MKETTKLYLFMGMFYYPIVAIGSYDPRAGQMFGYILGGILLGFMLGVHKMFILQELQQKKIEQYEQMVDGMADFLQDCKDKGDEDTLNNIKVFDGKEIKTIEEVVKEKQESNFYNCEDECCNGDKKDAKNEDKSTGSDSGNEDQEKH